MLKELLIFSGAFLGSLISMLLDYKKQLKDYKSWLIALVLSFAVYGIYEVLVAVGYIPLAISEIALFGIAIFIGFSLKQLTKKFWEVLRK